MSGKILHLAPGITLDHLCLRHSHDRQYLLICDSGQVLAICGGTGSDIAAIELSCGARYSVEELLDLVDAE